MQNNICNMLKIQRQSKTAHTHTHAHRIKDLERYQADCSDYPWDANKERERYAGGIWLLFLYIAVSFDFF